MEAPSSGPRSGPAVWSNRYWSSSRSVRKHVVSVPSLAQAVASPHPCRRLTRFPSNVAIDAGDSGAAATAEGAVDVGKAQFCT